MSHCALLQAGEIQAIVGDASRNGVGGMQYCGLWSLTSQHRVFNAFGNSYAGLIPGEIRGKSPLLEVVDAHTCLLSRQADAAHPVDVHAAYQIAPPYYIDHTLTLRDQRDARRTGCDFREVSWCCYMNCPEDSRLHFLSGGEWFRYISPKHGIGSNIAPSFLPQDQLETWPARKLRETTGLYDPFHWDRIERGFDQPFYYGRLGNMVMILIFDDPRRLRFFCSPSGGGESLRAGEHCPAWDFEWVIPGSEYTVGKEYAFRTRLVYKPYISAEDVLVEVRRAQTELGFEAAPGSP